MTLLAPQLEHFCDIEATVSPIMDAGPMIGLGRTGQRRIIPITGGRLLGPHIQGRVLPGGADFQWMASDTTIDLDARYLIALDGDYAGEHIFVKNSAIRRAPAEVVAKMSRGEAVDPALVYFRCVPTFEVSTPRLQWMTESFFVGSAMRAPDFVQISFYRVL